MLSDEELDKLERTIDPTQDGASNRVWFWGDLKKVFQELRTLRHDAKWRESQLQNANGLLKHMTEEFNKAKDRLKAADRLRYFSGALYGDLCADDEQLTQYNSWFEFEKAIEAYDKAKGVEVPGE